MNFLPTWCPINADKGLKCIFKSCQNAVRVILMLQSALRLSKSYKSVWNMRASVYRCSKTPRALHYIFHTMLWVNSHHLKFLFFFRFHYLWGWRCVLDEVTRGKSRWFPVQIRKWDCEFWNYPMTRSTSTTYFVSDLKKNWLP